MKGVSAGCSLLESRNKRLDHGTFSWNHSHLEAAYFLQILRVPYNMVLSGRTSPLLFDSVVASNS